ncbi:hypothetical protein L9F63_014638 [Diploptera punctata]|uniref:Peptidase S1 domain-containing protein n=1 Tax=Diploptera punctata TaxID=6984 RepID=A0AAD8EL67_DIPPU|nr:hypothetical protein L9F63_014638 [Diploptera punctata]
MMMHELLFSNYILATVIVVNLLLNNFTHSEEIEEIIGESKQYENLNSSDLISNRGYTIDDCTCVCGKSNEYENGGIVGGIPSIPGEFPWTVALLRDDKFFCGGTLITRFHVLTAAHCLESVSPEEITVVLGEYDRTNPTETNTEVRNLVSGIQHDNFELTTFDNDIGLLELDSSVDFTPNIRAACLPNVGDDKHYVGRKAVVVGWGRVKEEGRLSNVLRKVELPILTKSTCLSIAGSDEITNNMICTGYPEGRKDACTGDSGGPIHLDGKVIGIVSWGEGCARPNTPGVFTKVLNYLDWIKSHIGEQCLCPPSERGKRKMRLPGHQRRNSFHHSLHRPFRYNTK